MRECEAVQEALSAMLDGELSRPERAAVEAHLAKCPDCRALYEAYGAVSSALEQEEVPEDLHARIMSAVWAAGASEPEKKPRGQLLWLRPALTAAACLVVIVGALLIVRPGFGRSGSAAPEMSESAGALDGGAENGGGYVSFEEDAAEETVENAERFFFAADQGDRSSAAPAEAGGAMNGSLDAPAAVEEPRAAKAWDDCDGAAADPEAMECTEEAEAPEEPEEAEAPESAGNWLLLEVVSAEKDRFTAEVLSDPTGRLEQGRIVTVYMTKAAVRPGDRVRAVYDEMQDEDGGVSVTAEALLPEEQE